MDYKQIEYRRVSGDNNTTAQSFYSNKNSIEFPNQTTVDNFEIPMYTASGGTLDFYSQDPNSVFTNLNNPFIRYYFTANTFSISANTSIIFQVYKLDFTTYSNYQPNFTPLNTNQQNVNNQQTQQETVTVDGVTTVTTRVISTTNSAVTQNATAMQLSTFDDIQNLLENPFYVFEVAYSSVTIPYYDLIFPVYVKSTGTTSGNLTQKLFEDRSQYFVKTIFKFSFPTSNTYVSESKVYSANQAQEFSDFINSEQLIYPSYYAGQTYNNDQYIYPNASNNFNVVDFPVYSATTYFETAPDVFISAGTFQNSLVGGRFFTYFQVPNKPILEEPLVQGQLDTFSPKFYYSNVIDGDYSQLEISYGTGFSFSDEVVVYPVVKNLSSANIQEASASIRANATNFCYRIGNVKHINNIFGIDQRIITYTDTITATTQNAAASTFVFTQVDSPYTSDIAPYVNPSNIDNSVPGFYTLSGQVSGSTINQCKITLVYPNSSQVSISSDTQGNYTFSGLTYGNYTLITEYRDYKTSSQSFSMVADKELGYRIIVLWSSTADTWADKATDKMGYNTN